MWQLGGRLRKVVEAAVAKLICRKQEFMASVRHIGVSRDIVPEGFTHSTFGVCVCNMSCLLVDCMRISRMLLSERLAFLSISWIAVPSACIVK